MLVTGRSCTFLYRAGVNDWLSAKDFALLGLESSVPTSGPIIWFQLCLERACARSSFLVD